MKKTYLIFTLLVGICFTTLGQNFNSHKYVVVPEKYDFLKESNEYQMNELTKFLFEKQGFQAFLKSEEKPLDWRRMACAILYADVIEDSGFFQTKLQIVLKDCNDKILFTSEIGSSREKDFKKANQEALRNAFKSLENISYKYDENSEEKVNETLTGQDQTKSAPVAEEVQEVKVEETKVAEILLTPIPSEAEKPSRIQNTKRIKQTFVSGDKEFYLLDTDFGFQLYQNQMQEPFAKLIKTKSLNNFIYLSLQNSGIAFFDETGNLNVEILNAQENSTAVKIYSPKN